MQFKSTLFTDEFLEGYPASLLTLEPHYDKVCQMTYWLTKQMI